MSSTPPSPPAAAEDAFRLPRALERAAGAPVAASAPPVPAALRAFNHGLAAEPEPVSTVVVEVQGAVVDVPPPAAPAPPPAVLAPPPPPVTVPPPAPPSAAVPAPAPRWEARPDPSPPPDASATVTVAVAALRRRWRGLGLAAAALAVVATVVVTGSRSGLTALTAEVQTAAPIAQARDRAARGDVEGAVAELVSQATSASPDARTLLRDAAAGILADAARAAAGQRNAVVSLSLLRQAAGFTDTPQGRDARAALPRALVDAARQRLATPPSDTSAAQLLREAIATAPGSEAATEASQLLAQPVPVSGRLSVAGAAPASLQAAVFAIAPAPAGTAPAPASPAPVASAGCAADGGFSLGVVPPGTYLFGYIDAKHRTHLGPQVTIAPAQAGNLVVTLPG